MDFIEALLWFILGIFFDAWIRPAMDSLVNLFNSIIDSHTAKSQIEIAKANERIQSLQEPVGNSNVIGFQTPDTIEYYDYDEDDDDDL